MLERTLQRVALRGQTPARVLRPASSPRETVTVSVVIPCYNYGRYLTDSISSALEQENVEVQVLVVDDASTDDSVSVAREMAASDKRIQLVTHNENQGHIRTYNDGLGRVEGEFVVLLSADDLLTPGALGRATALLASHPAVGLVYGAALPFTGKPRVRRRGRVQSWIIWSGQDWIADRCRTGRNRIWNPEAMLRTSVLQEIGGYREDLPRSGDFEMWMRAAAVSDVGFVSGPIQAMYRQHGRNMTQVMHRGELVDLEERLKAFDAILFERTGRLKDVEQLGFSARRALAREAIVHASRQRSIAAADSAVESLIAFAVQAWPGVCDLEEWQALQCGQGSSLRPSSGEATVGRVRQKLEDHARVVRHRRLGI
jgi:glycosyltransferase involved in cell wall biosynthesis